MTWRKHVDPPVARNYVPAFESAPIGLAEETMPVLKTSEEFSRPVSLARALQDGVRLSIVANDHERAALAEKLGLLLLDRLEIRAELAADGLPGAVRLKAHWEADVVQSCVVTLEPVASVLQESFEQTFVPAATLDGAASARSGEVVLDPEADEPPESVEGDTIDIGRAVVEQVALALDPYPRQPGAELTLPELVSGEAKQGEGPFAKLHSLAGKGSYC